MPDSPCPEAYTPAGRRRLHALTSLRFFAALAVFLHHMLPTGGHASGIGRLVWEGSAGVTFFFILSGFVLAYGYAQRLAARPPGGIRAFYVARFARIYPLVLLTFAIAAIPTFWERITAGPAAVMPMIFQITLTQAWTPIVDPISHNLIPITFNAPAWSLSAEAYFYLMFPIFAAALWRIRRPQMLVATAALLMLWPVALAAAYNTSPAADYWYLYVLPPNRLADFLIGICLGLALLRTDVAEHRRSVRWAAVEAATLAALLGAVVLSNQLSIRYRYDAYYLPFMALVIAVFALERGHISQALRHRRLLYLGEISFAFYMIHTLVMSYAGLPAGRPGTQYHVAAYAAILVVSVALSALLHRAYELPAQNRVRRWLSPRPTSAPAVAAAASADPGLVAPASAPARRDPATASAVPDRVPA
jgi:peptidoglycan/LPS O-acetylase OafA/YrhL